jgi:predicted ATPase/class 3 adenylate cyclase
MLFTDIEGSTRLLRALEGDYGDVLARQRTIMRRAIADHEGHEMGTEGDSFFVVFSSVREGAAAAIAAQRALATEAWPSSAEVRVRMGLHVGEPARHEEGYMGIDLNRAARIAATANGGQVVVSADVAAEVGDALSGVELRDLGRHHLKDLPEPEHLFQLVVEGLPDITSPIKSLGTPSNLPASRAELLGRDELMSTVAGLLTGGTRCVTLTGPGGTGKTSLGLETAHSLEALHLDGVYFVALETAWKPEPAWEAIAAALGVGGQDDASRAVIDRVGSRKSLLVLDNLEQLDGAAALVSTLLDHTGAAVLATSRGPLHIRGEREVAIPPLALPATDTLESVAASPAGRLFLAEARRVRAGFELGADNAADVASICRMLDGSPLAIELAAARTRLMSPKALAAALERRIDVGARAGDRPDRQQTLAATIRWSYDLLDDASRAAGTAAAVFAAGCDLEAIQSVLSGASVAGSWDLDATLTAVEALADVSLIALADGPSGEPRLSMLRAVREFARAAAPPREVALAQQAHATYWAHFVEEAEPKLRGSDPLVWSDRIITEEDNLRAALSWALDAEAPAALRLARRLGAALGWFWYTHGRAREGREWLERAAGRGADEDPRLEARLRHALGVLQQQVGENELAAGSFESSLTLFRSLDDSKGIAQQLNSLGVTRLAQGRLEDAGPLLEESAGLARAGSDLARLASTLSNLGLVGLAEGDAERAGAAFHEAVAIDEQQGNEWGVAVGRCNLAAALVRGGDLDEAVRLVTETLPSVVTIDDTELLITAIEVSAAAAAALDRAELAASLDGGANALRQASDIPRMAFEEIYMERELAPVRMAMGRAAYDEASSAGASLSGDELVALALSLGRRG